MEHAFKQKVFYSDTDAYGVVWHGSYLRWLEMGRVYLAEKTGYTLIELEKQDIVLPVAEINVKYKNSAKLNETIVIKTKVQEYSRCSMTFHQEIVNEQENKTYIIATVKVVAIHKDGTLYRSLPEQVMKLVQ